MIAGGCRKIPLGRTRTSDNITAGDSTRAVVVCAASSTCRDSDPATHRLASGVANGLFAFAKSPDMNLNGN
jgi:hypothetical protein